MANKEPPPYIDDGYTRRSKIDTKRDPTNNEILCGPITFDWRGTSAGKRATYYDFLGDNKAGKSEHDLLATILANHLIAWDRKGDISQESISQLHPEVFSDLVHIVIFMDKAPDEEMSLTKGLEPKAELEGVSLEEYLAKNSETGSISSIPTQG